MKSNNICDAYNSMDSLVRYVICLHSFYLLTQFIDFFVYQFIVSNDWNKWQMLIMFNAKCLYVLKLIRFD